MEEAEKRKERLQAMRAEAASASMPGPDAAGHHLLPSPFSSTDPSSSAASPSFSLPPRFDYYTDPLGSFSSATNKRKPPRGDSVLQSPHGFSYDATPPAAGHGVLGNSPRMQAHGQWRSPMRMNPPFETNPNHASPSFRSPNYTDGFHHQPRGISFIPSPNPNSTPNFVSGMGSGMAGFSPNSNSSPRGMGSGYGSFSPNHNSNLNLGRGRGGFSPIHNPSFGSGKESGRGGFSPNQTPNFSSGRGGGRYHGGSPRSVSGRNGGRGRGFVSAQECPWRFYHKSMVEDPWKGLVPIVGRLLEAEPHLGRETPDSLRSWLPKSIASKKAKVATDTVQLNPQSSIAECLALSFEDAVTDLPDH
ncbi:protein SICKLE [Nymphaea colorata]|nr:protein SICKLE [Nymphaea colorata]